MRKPLEIPYVAFKQFKSDFNKNQVYRDLKERERKTQEKLKTTLGLNINEIKTPSKCCRKSLKL